jgi:PDZ domain-containing secreted protein
LPLLNLVTYVRSFEEIADMKTLALILSLGLLGSAASASAYQAGATTEKSHQVQAEVVSVDTAKSTMTIKASDGMEKTATVEGSAVSQLKNLKSGDKVTLTCRDDDKGEHRAVTAIQKSSSSEPRD